MLRAIDIGKQTETESLSAGWVSEAINSQRRLSRMECFASKKIYLIGRYVRNIRTNAITKTHKIQLFVKSVIRKNILYQEMW